MNRKVFKKKLGKILKLFKLEMDFENNEAQKFKKKIKYTKNIHAQ